MRSPKHGFHGLENKLAEAKAYLVELRLNGIRRNQVMPTPAAAQCALWTLLRVSMGIDPKVRKIACDDLVDLLMMTRGPFAIFQCHQMTLLQVLEQCTEPLRYKKGKQLDGS